MRMTGWLEAAVASQSRPTSGPLTSRTAATRRAWLAATSVRKASAIRPGSPNSRIAASTARVGESPAPLVAVGGIEQPGAQLGHDAGTCLPGAWQAGRDLGEVTLYLLRAPYVPRATLSLRAVS